MNICRRHAASGTQYMTKRLKINEIFSPKWNITTNREIIENN